MQEKPCPQIGTARIFNGTACGLLAQGVKNAYTVNLCAWLDFVKIYRNRGLKMFVEGYILHPWNVLLGFAKSENDFEKRFEVFLLFFAIAFVETKD